MLGKYLYVTSEIVCQSITAVSVQVMLEGESIDFMKKLLIRIKEKILSFIKWIWAECKDWRTLVLLGIVCLVLGLPVWGGYLLGLLFRWEWAFWDATVAWCFWMLPGAPYFALSVSITLAIKRIFEKRHAKRLGLSRPNQDSEDQTRGDHGVPGADDT